MGDVVDIVCIGCEKKIGSLMIHLEDDEIHIEFPMCKGCHDEILQSPGPMSDRTARDLLDKMVKRGYLDDYIWDCDPPKEAG